MFSLHSLTKSSYSVGSMLDFVHLKHKSIKESLQLLAVWTTVGFADHSRKDYEHFYGSLGYRRWKERLWLGKYLL